MAIENQTMGDFLKSRGVSVTPTEPTEPTETQTQDLEEEFGFWDGVGDTFRGIGRGVLGAVENVAEFGNVIPGVNYDIYDTDDLLDPTETMVGSAAESLTQFITVS